MPFILAAPPCFPSIPRKTIILELAKGIILHGTLKRQQQRINYIGNPCMANTVLSSQAHVPEQNNTAGRNSPPKQASATDETKN